MRREGPALPLAGGTPPLRPRSTSRPASPHTPRGAGRERAPPGNPRLPRRLPARFRSGPRQPPPQAWRYKMAAALCLPPPSLPSALPATETAAAASPPPSGVKILTGAQREAARREPALNSADSTLSKTPAPLFLTGQNGGRRLPRPPLYRASPLPRDVKQQRIRGRRCAD